MFTQPTVAPALILAGMSGGLLTGWSTDDVNLPLARRALAPAQPSFTKHGEEPQYRLVIRNDLDYDAVESRGFESVADEVEAALLAATTSFGMQHVSTVRETEQSSQSDAVVLLCHSAEPLQSVDAKFLELSTRVSGYITVTEFEGLSMQCYIDGSYDSGVIGMVSDFLSNYTNSARAQLQKFESYFDTRDVN